MLVASSLAASALSTMASCSSDPDAVAGIEPFDAGPVDTPDAISTPEDSGAVDAGPPPPDTADAATTDAGPRPVVCTSTPCATSLVTTLGGRDGYCALLSDGTVACWGNNYSGELGRGPGQALDSATPARVSGLSNIVALDHTCAVDVDGAVWCWGRGAFLNPVTAFSNENAPRKLPIEAPATKAATYVGGIYDPNPDTISLAEYGVACALVDDGLLCWGKNDNAQLGPRDDPYATQALSPRLVPLPSGAKVRSIHLGMASFAILEDGTLLSWGFNPAIGRVSSLFPDPHPKAVPLTGVTSVDTYETVACATAQGTAYCWRDVVNLDESFHDHALPEPIPTPEPVVQVSTTGRPDARACAVGVSGDVYCWGKNDRGMAGDGTTNHAATPVKVVGLPAPASEVRAMDASTCALLTTGKVYCWGDNRFGQLGGGTKKPSLVPLEVLLP